MLIYGETERGLKPTTTCLTFAEKQVFSRLHRLNAGSGLDCSPIAVVNRTRLVHDHDVLKI